MTVHVIEVLIAVLTALSMGGAFLVVAQKMFVKLDKLMAVPAKVDATIDTVDSLSARVDSVGSKVEVLSTAVDGLSDTVEAQGLALRSLRPNGSSNNGRRTGAR